MQTHLNMHYIFAACDMSYLKMWGLPVQYRTVSCSGYINCLSRYSKKSAFAVLCIQETWKIHPPKEYAYA